MFERSGEVGRDLLAVDWAATPLGDLDTWPSSLESVVRLMLTSRFSMWMAWGPDLTFFCNEAYRRDTLGNKYPWALGKPAPVVWSEIWDEVGPLVQDVLKTGTSFEYAIGKDAQSNPKLVPLAELQAPKIDPAKLNSKKVTDLMTAAGLL